MLLHHPIMTIRHYFDEAMPKVKLKLPYYYIDGYWHCEAFLGSFYV